MATQFKLQQSRDRDSFRVTIEKRNAGKGHFHRLKQTTWDKVGEVSDNQFLVKIEKKLDSLEYLQRIFPPGRGPKKRRTL